MQVILIMDYLNNNKNKSSFTKLKFLKKASTFMKKLWKFFQYYWMRYVQYKTTAIGIDNTLDPGFTKNRYRYLSNVLCAHVEMLLWLMEGSIWVLIVIIRGKFMGFTVIIMPAFVQCFFLLCKNIPSIWAMLLKINLAFATSGKSCISSRLILCKSDKRNVSRKFEFMVPT